MNHKKPNTTHLWKQLEDALFPRLRFSITDRAVYSHLIRHTRLEGKLQLHCSMPWIARALGISTGPVRESVRRLAVLGALRLVQRSKAGHILEVRLPDEMRSAPPNAVAVGDPVNASSSATLALATRTRACRGGSLFTLRDSKGHAHSAVNPHSVDLDKLDFLKTRALRNSIHLRERGHCFYCLRRTDARVQCLDHVVPRVKAGQNSYRNLVSACLECNSQKGERSATDFLRSLYRDRRLTASELQARLRTLDALTAGKLPPPVQHPDSSIGVPTNPMPRKGRPRRALSF